MLPETPPPVKKRKIIDGSFLILAGFTGAAGVAVAVLHGGAHTLSIILHTLGFLALLSPKIAAGVFIAATLPLILPREKVAGWIGRESGLRGLSLAMIAGAAIPGGPMMTFPLAAGFTAAGADLGAITAFVSGWSLLGLNRTLIWEFSFLPSDLVIVRYLVSLPLPILMGLATRLLYRKVIA